MQNKVIQNEMKPSPQNHKGFLEGLFVYKYIGEYNWQKSFGPTYQCLTLVRNPTILMSTISA